MSRIHAFNPLHVIEVRPCALCGLFRVFLTCSCKKKWNGLHFEKSSLRETGHVLQLGHHPADLCTNPQRSTKPFTIIHTSGIHIVDLAYCGCDQAGNHGTRVQQLLRRRLFPATTLDPQTACSFLLLKSAQLLSLQSKLSLYDYYLCIEKLTDATGTTGVNVSYFSCSFLVDRAETFEGPVQGFSPIASDVASHQDGKAWWSVIRSNWDRGHLTRRTCRPLPGVPHPFCQPPTQLALCRERSRVRKSTVYSLTFADTICVRFLYYQSFGIDACFRFKRRQISNYEKDPELGPGYAYLVAWDSYSEYLRCFTNQEEVRCVRT